MPRMHEGDMMGGRSLVSHLWSRFQALLRDVHNRTVLFQLGNWIFVTFGLFVGLGFFLGFSCGMWYDAMSGQDVSMKARFYLFGLLPFVLIGARFFSILLEWRLIFCDPYATLFKPGYMLHGGLFGGLAALWVYSVMSDQNMARVLDTAAFAFPLGASVGRLGCYVYGCCWGKPTSSRFGVRYLSESAKVVRCDPELRGVRIHPVQLYGALLYLLMFIAFVSLLPHKRFDGMFMVLFCLIQPILRVILETFRQDDRGRFLGPLTHTHLYSAILFGLGWLGLIYFSQSRSEFQSRPEHGVGVDCRQSDCRTILRSDYGDCPGGIWCAPSKSRQLDFPEGGPARCKGGKHIARPQPCARPHRA